MKIMTRRLVTFEIAAKLLFWSYSDGQKTKNVTAEDLYKLATQRKINHVRMSRVKKLWRFDLQTLGDGGVVLYEKSRAESLRLLYLRDKTTN